MFHSSESIELLPTQRSRLIQKHIKVTTQKHENKLKQEKEKEKDKEWIHRSTGIPFSSSSWTAHFKTILHLQVIIAAKHALWHPLRAVFRGRQAFLCSPCPDETVWHTSQVQIKTTLLTINPFLQIHICKQSKLETPGVDNIRVVKRN